MEALEVYQPPFSSDGCCVWSSNGVMALMDASNFRSPDAMLRKLASILNGEEKPSGGTTYVYDSPEIYADGKLLLVVRGWGHLTGSGGLNLHLEEAERIQDQFAEWVISKLNQNG